MHFACGPTVLTIDEARLPAHAAEDAAALFQAISRRSLKTPIIPTTNRGVVAWGDIFDDTTVG